MFTAASKKNNNHRRYGNKHGSSGPFNYNSSKSYRDNSYRDKMPPTGSAKFDADSTFKDHPVQLEGRSSEELKSWLNSTLTPILRKKGAMNLIDQPGILRRGPPSDAMYATNVGPAKDRMQEERKKEEDIHRFQTLQGETFNEVVKAIAPSSIAYNLISQLVTEDVHGNNLNDLIKVLKEHIGGAGTICGLFDHVISFLTFANDCEDCKPEHIIPRAYLFLGELKNFEITSAVPAVLAPDGSVQVAAVPAVTCEMPEPLRVFVALAIASLAGNSALINEFVRREFGTKHLSEQKDFSKARWTPVMETMKAYMKCERDFTPKPEVTVSAHFTKPHDGGNGNFAGGGYKIPKKKPAVFNGKVNGKSSAGPKNCIVCGEGNHKTGECKLVDELIEKKKNKRNGKRPRNNKSDSKSSSSNRHIQPFS